MGASRRPVFPAPFPKERVKDMSKTRAEHAAGRWTHVLFENRAKPVSSQSTCGRDTPSAERSGLPKMVTLGSEPPGQDAHLVFACFQCDLLGKHHVADWQITDRCETQPLAEATSFVDLTHIDRGASIDPVLVSGVASDDI